MQFQKRKLNTCLHCDDGVKGKELALEARPDGSLYFICLTHRLILRGMQEAAARIGIQF